MTGIMPYFNLVLFISSSEYKIFSYFDFQTKRNLSGIWPFNFLNILDQLLSLFSCTNTPLSYVEILMQYFENLQEDIGNHRLSDDVII